MNLLDIILKIFMGHNQSSMNPSEIGNQILLQLKKILKSLIILFIGSVLFCLLMSYLIERILFLMDQGNLHFSNSIIFLLALISLNLITIAWALKIATAKDGSSKESTQQPAVPTTSPIETAVAALIFDFIKDQERKREHQNENHQPPGSST